MPVNTTVQNRPADTPTLICDESHAAGVAVYAAGVSGTVTIYDVIDGMRFPAAVANVGCNPPTQIAALVGPEYCIEVDSVECVHLAVRDVTQGTVDSINGGGGPPADPCVTVFEDDYEGIPIVSPQDAEARVPIVGGPYVAESGEVSPTFEVTDNTAPGWGHLPSTALHRANVGNDPNRGWRSLHAEATGQFNVIEAQTIENSNSQFGVIVRYQDPDNILSVHVNRANNNVYLRQRATAGAADILLGAYTPGTLPETRDWRIELDGEDITVTLNGTTYPTVTRPLATVGATSNVGAFVLNGTSTGALLYLRACNDPNGGVPPTPAVPYPLGPLPANLQDIAWPEEPTITNGDVMVSNDSHWTMVDGTRYIVAAGTYTPKTIDCNNCEFVLDDNAIIDGQLTFAGHHIKWTGGQKIGAGSVDYLGLDAVGDLLIDNLHAVNTGGALNNFSAQNEWERIAIINSTFEVQNGAAGGGWCIYVQQEFPVDSVPFRGYDMIIANVKLIADGQTIRLNTINNLVIVDSYFNPTNTATNGYRVHHGTQDYFLRDVIAVGESSNSTGEPQVIDGTIENLTRYGPTNASLFFGPASNTSNVTINGSQGHVLAANWSDVPPNLWDASGSNPNILSWDGTTLPDASGYGADH